MLINEVESKPTIYVLVGLPGSGKSTWRAKNATNATVISSDDYIDGIAKLQGLTYNDVFTSNVKAATANMHQSLKTAIESRDDIVWDQTNLTSKKRADILRRVPGYHTVAVIFELDQDELLRRLHTRSAETGKTIPDSVLTSMMNSYVEPTEAEGFDEVVFA